MAEGSGTQAIDEVCAAIVEAVAATRGADGWTRPPRSRGVAVMPTAAVVKALVRRGFGKGSRKGSGRS